MHRRGFLAGLGALVASPWLAGCAKKQPLVLGIHPWIGYETLYLARGFNWLPPAVRFHEAKTATDLLVAMRDGVLDAACLTLDETLRARAEGIPLSAALVFDTSTGAEAVLARPSIQNLSDLAGKRLGVEQNALGLLMLAKLLETAGLRSSDLTVIDLPMDKQLSAWRRNEVDAVIAFEPTSAHLKREGARILFDGRRIPETIFDVLAVRMDRAKAHHDTLKAIVEGHFRGLTHIQANRQDAIYRTAGRRGVDPGEIQRALSGVLLSSIAGNREYLSKPDSRLIQAARSISSILVQRGALKREDTLESLVTPAWLPRDGG